MKTIFCPHGIASMKRKIRLTADRTANSVKLWIGEVDLSKAGIVSGIKIGIRPRELIQAEITLCIDELELEGEATMRLDDGKGSALEDWLARQGLRVEEIKTTYTREGAE